MRARNAKTKMDIHGLSSRQAASGRIWRTTGASPGHRNPHPVAAARRGSMAAHRPAGGLTEDETTTNTRSRMPRHAGQLPASLRDAPCSNGFPVPQRAYRQATHIPQTSTRRLGAWKAPHPKNLISEFKQAEGSCRRRYTGGGPPTRRARRVGAGRSFRPRYPPG